VFIQGVLTPVPQELLHIIEIRGIRRPVVVVGSVMNDETSRKRKLKTVGTDRISDIGYIVMLVGEGEKGRRGEGEKGRRGEGEKARRREGNRVPCREQQTMSASHKSCAFFFT
jgi:hypothetical protein